jgi:single-strand DNA-binding protein
MNLTILVGNITKDIESRQVGSTTVAKFSIATSEKWNDKKTGEKKEAVQFHNCEFWGKGGEVFAQYHSKGDRACITGMIEYGDYEKDGVKRYTTTIKVKSFEFVKNSGGKSTSNAPQESLPSRDIHADVDDSEQLPF